MSAFSSPCHVHGIGRRAQCTHPVVSTRTTSLARNFAYIGRMHAVKTRFARSLPARSVRVRALSTITTATTITKSELSRCRVAELREMCVERGLSSAGLKPELVQRLLDESRRGYRESSSEEEDSKPTTSGRDAEETSGVGAETSTSTSTSAATGTGDETRQRFPYTVTWLGTSSGAPTSRRNVSSMALRLSPTSVVLVDCGEGTRNQLRTAKIPAGDISHIFITHLHGDHCFGIAGTLLAIMNARRGTPRAKEPVHIYGPPELHRLVAASCKAAQMTLEMPVIVTGFTLDPRKEVLPARAVIPNEENYLVALQAPSLGSLGGAALTAKHRSRLQELQRAYEAGSDQIVQNGLTWDVDVLLAEHNVSVTSAQLQHRMPCWGYVFENVQDGDRRKIVLLGDTCNSEAIARAAMGCDVISHEATYKVGMEDKAKIATHSTSADAGQFAGRVGAKALVLTHFSARYDQVDKYKKMFVKAREKGMKVAELQGNNVSVLKDEAKEAAGDGVKVYLANDYYRYEVR